MPGVRTQLHERLVTSVLGLLPLALPPAISQPLPLGVGLGAVHPTHRTPRVLHGHRPVAFPLTAVDWRPAQLLGEFLEPAQPLWALLLGWIF